ncbi:nucleoside deaminase [Melioribacter sp. Ez-97]|uniref:nucleoside deaminase n=1 Tax=Melioribacter sp. Ez-97 TaxID=3423434 RepID=UPI003ED9D20A
MIFPETVYKNMFAALQEAEKAFEENESPIGAVVVYQNKIIGRGYNQTERLKDPTAHAEMIAITSAANYLSDWRLNECDIYVTAEPCIMCTGALLLSRIKTIYFGAYQPKFGACGSLLNLIETSNYNHKPKVYSGIYESESKALLEEFFRRKREP